MERVSGRSAWIARIATQVQRGRSRKARERRTGSAGTGPGVRGAIAAARVFEGARAELLQRGGHVHARRRGRGEERGKGEEVPGQDGGAGEAIRWFRYGRHVIAFWFSCIYRKVTTEIRSPLQPQPEYSRGEIIPIPHCHDSEHGLLHSRECGHRQPLSPIDLGNAVNNHHRIGSGTTMTLSN